MNNSFAITFPKLLALLKVSVPAAELSHALKKYEAADAYFVRENLKHLLFEIKVVGFKAMVLSWERFDQRAAPVLVFHKDEWKLLTHDSAGDIQLTDSDGISESIDTNQLEAAPVLWLRPQMSSLESDQVKTVSAMNLLLDAFKRNKKWLSEIAVASVFVNLLAVMTSIYAMQVYDRVVPTFAYATLTALTVGMFLVVGIDWVLKFMRARILDILSKKIDMQLSKQSFEHMLHSQTDKLPNSVGLLSAQVSSVESVRGFMSSTIIFSLVDLPFVIFFIMFVYIIGGQVALVYLFALPIAAGLGWYGKQQAQKLYKEEIIRSTEKQGYLVETIQGLDVIQSTNSTWRFQGHWQDLNEDINHFSVKTKQVGSFVTTSTATLSSLTYLGAIVVGVFQIEAGLLTMGGLIACSILGGRIIAPMAQSAQFLFQLQSVLESLNLASRLFEVPQRPRSEFRTALLDRKPTQLTVEDISYSYGDEPVVRLQLYKLSLNAGDRVVLLGNIGSGKSTLLRHLAGLITLQKGTIKLSNIDIWQLAPEELSQHVGYLPQDVRLFKGTLRSNLNMANSASDEFVMKVSDELGITKFAESHPQKMEMPILEGGKGLSIGQKQLVGLARIVLSGPTVWLLDEPTASLDSETEQKVLKTLFETIKPDDIVVIATHRKSLLALANRVLVLHEGRVLADKKPEELFTDKPNNEEAES